ncbi:MAG TPA: phosphate ABC transporter ATP-binding protein [Treponema sp.]|nr:phosphate ABC transporter ATP-binding protein [Treponema sp.]
MKIELKNLDKLYESDNAVSVHAVNNVSLNIPSNEIFGIIGKSGAGKSTLVRLISLLEKPDSGEVWYDSTRVDNLEGKALIERRRRIGMIFQNFNLFSSRNAEQNIAYPMEITGTPKARIKQRTKELLELVGLSDRAKSPVSQLSGGQKQRIAIARALANEPDILFCDEATSALDPKTTQSILDLIRKIQKQMNLTVVMITHQMEVVRDACSQVAVVNEGRIVEQGTVKEIFMNPKSPVTKDFINHLAPEEEAEKGDNIVRWSNDGGNYYLRFYGDKTDMPLLSRTAKKFDIEYNIRAGGIQSVQGDKVGAMLIDFIGDEAEIQKAIEFLRENGVGVEKNESDN